MDQIFKSQALCENFTRTWPITIPFFLPLYIIGLMYLYNLMYYVCVCFSYVKLFKNKSVYSFGKQMICKFDSSICSLKHFFLYIKEYYIQIQFLYYYRMFQAFWCTVIFEMYLCDCDWKKIWLVFFKNKFTPILIYLCTFPIYRNKSWYSDLFKNNLAEIMQLWLLW